MTYYNNKMYYIILLSYIKMTYSDSVGQRSTVNGLVGLFDVSQIDFRSAYDDPDQLTVIGAETRH